MRTLFVFFLLACICAPLVVTFARPTGAPIGHTGAPAVNGRNCTACHNGSVNSGPGSVTIEAHPTFVPGSLVPVRMYLSNMQNANKNGFQLAAYDGTNRILSGWTNIDGATALAANHVNHTGAGNRQSSWIAYLQAPSTPTAFSFYGAGLDADGDGKNKNDRTYTTSLSMTPGTVNLSITALPRIGGTLALNLHAPQEAGKSYALAASFGRAGIKIGGRTIPLSPDPLMIATAQNLIPSLFRRYQGQLDATGRATSQLVVPNNAALRGITLHHAFIVIDPSQPNGIGTVSNPLPVTML